MYARWYSDNMWLFVPVGGKVNEFISTIPNYPFQEGAAMNPSGINYNSLKAASVLKRLQEGGVFKPN
jgi:hypothetical protein